MGVYNDNQLPESPTTQFQMAVSILYTLFVSVMLGNGAFPVLAAQHKPDKEAPASTIKGMPGVTAMRTCSRVSRRLIANVTKTSKA